MNRWVIRHAPRLGAPLYWNGLDDSRMAIRMAFVPIKGAARFPTQADALLRFRGTYRPSESCCEAVLDIA